MRKKRVGIVSIFDNDNYGNRLQNYALVRVLNKYPKIQAYSLEPHNSRSAILHRLKYMFLKVNDKFKIIRDPKKERVFKRNYLFLRFNQLIPRHTVITDKQNRIPKKVGNNYDLFIVGSDQVWNINWVKPGNSFFYNFTLQFTEDYKKYSYAASVGTQYVDPRHMSLLVSELKKFKYVSFREQFSVNQISNEYNLFSYHDLDPTLLLKPNEWEEICNIKNNVKDRYVVIYFLGRRTEAINDILSRLNESGYRTVDLLDSSKPEYASGPCEFLEYIRNASLVLTDSFHATVFSVIFEKPFYVFNRIENGTPMGGRIPDFLETIGLTDYAYRKLDEQDLFTLPNYNSVRKRIDHLRTQSIKRIEEMK